MDTGKYCAYLDLRKKNQLTRMHKLAIDADIFATSYRDSLNQRFQPDPERACRAASKGHCRSIYQPLRTCGTLAGAALLRRATEGGSYHVKE